MITFFYPRLSFCRTFLAALLGVLLSGTALADYTVALLSDGSAARRVRVGEEFQLDIQLTSDSLDQHWSADLQVEFSSAGLKLVGYEWAAPFVTGGVDDVSVPAIANLPSIIDADLVPDGPGMTNQVDLFLSNFTTNAAGYGAGRILRLRLAVPEDYAGINTIRAQIVTGLFGNGFSMVPTNIAEPFWLQIDPADGQQQPALSISVTAGRISLSWPAIIQKAVLQMTTEMAGEWVDVLEPPQVVEGRNRVQLLIELDASPRFFRLSFQ